MAYHSEGACGSLEFLRCNIRFVQNLAKTSSSFAEENNVGGSWRTWDVETHH
jgi:hypothetical protein